MNEIEIEKVQNLDERTAADIQRLHSQVSSSPAPSADEIRSIASNPGTTLLVARERGGSRAVVGMLSVVSFRIPSGLRVWIEDVVVDQTARRRGIGEALNSAAIDYASSLGARTIDLTSRPSRTAANQLYLKLGFERRETNVYRLTLK
jgi:ribosomal protein S18 acetylase RimI-like enzyme